MSLDDLLRRDGKSCLECDHERELMKARKARREALRNFVPAPSQPHKLYVPASFMEFETSLRAKEYSKDIFRRRNKTAMVHCDCKDDDLHEPVQQRLDRDTLLMACEVLFLQTGGTIDKVYPQTPGAFGFEISNAFGESIYRKFVKSEDFFHFQTVCMKDSQYITDEDRQLMVVHIANSTREHVIITHGTDTLCETARYLVCAGVGQPVEGILGIAHKKVILTGSRLPGCVKESDADFNLGLAFGYLQGGVAPGVYVAIGGRVIRGEHIARTKAGTFVDKREFCVE